MIQTVIPMLSLVLVFMIGACGDDATTSENTGSDISDASSGDDVTDESPDARDADTNDDADATDSDATGVVDPPCDGACGVGELCVYANASATELSCVDGFEGAWDDGTDPARAFIDAETGWYRKRVDGWEEGDLRCNDGTPYGYYINPGVGDGANNWLIFFRGGASCTNAESCAARWVTQKLFMRQWRSVTPHYNPSWDGEANAYVTDRNAGRYSRTEPANLFRDWTWVHLHYCSSDVFTGTRLAADDPSGIWFRGFPIVTAVIAELLEGLDGSALGVEMPSLSDASRVIIGGGSAGSSATNRHLDRLANIIGEAVPGVTVHGLLDAAFGVPVIPSPPTPEGQPMGLEVWGAEGIADADCIEAHPDLLAFCRSAPHLLNGDGGSSLLGVEDSGHLGVAASDEQYAAIGVFTYMAERDALAVGAAGVAGLCIADECQGDDDCDPGQACLGAVCLNVAPCTPHYCIDREDVCHGTTDPPACLGMVVSHDNDCDTDTDCSSGFCESGFCVERRVSPCESSTDCPDGYACGRGTCSTPATGPADCDLAGYEYEYDTQSCEQVFDCDGANGVPCGAGFSCLPARFTPNAQTMAWGIRHELSGLDARHGAFVTNSVNHTITSSSRYYNHRINGVNMAESLRAWYEGDPSYSELIDPAAPVATPPRAWDVSAFGADGLDANTSGSGCTDDALLIRVCPLESDCGQTDALFTLGIGDTGSSQLDGVTPTGAERLKLVVSANQSCTPSGFSIPEGSWLTLDYQFGPDASDQHSLRIALPTWSPGGNSPTLPVTLYLGAGGSTFIDPAYEQMAASRLD